MSIKLKNKVNKQRSATMRAVKAQDSKIEVLIRKKLFSLGYRFRKNDKKLFGKPDISMKRRKTVIFIDSCFWHGCKDHLRMPKSNKNYWVHKIKRNVLRDKEVTKFYRKIGWQIIRVWEHDLIKIDKVLKRIDKLCNREN